MAVTFSRRQLFVQNGIREIEKKNEGSRREKRVGGLICFETVNPFALSKEGRKEGRSPKLTALNS